MRTEARHIDLNGSHGEGGGALFRTALQMSALTQQPVTVRSIRGALRKPGLNAEDLTFLQAIGAACGADVDDADLRSDRITFQPRHMPRAVNTLLDIHAHEQGMVPGSALVVAQSLAVVLCRAGAWSRLTVAGETHGAHVLGYDAFERSTCRVHEVQGLVILPTLQTAGFGYGARGEISVDIEPGACEPLQWTSRGRLQECGLVLTHNGQPDRFVETQVEAARQLLSAKALDPEVEVVPVHARATGACLTIWARYERGMGSGSASIGKIPADQLAFAACRSFNDWHDSASTLDAYLADQALIPAVLADGKTVFSTSFITRRLITMAWVIKQFLPVKITILGREGEPGTVTIEK
ncbi:MAG: RNA 3'-terminal phosphate cyclase [Fimbriimonadaceae bacterium]|nr:RNA 3'-terminal phosphate cyclase [Fimbriimonadaceae bacterium]